MHIDEVTKACEDVINRAKNGESLTGDDRIVKASGTIIRAHAVKIDYARARGERPEITALESRDAVTQSASRLAREGVNKRAVANHRS